MKTKEKIILGIVSLILSRLSFLLINDPEGPNLLIVTVFAIFIYSLFLTLHSIYKKFSK